MFQVPFTDVPGTQFSARALPSSFDLACISQMSSTPHPEDRTTFFLRICITAWAAEAWNCGLTWGRAVFFRVEMALFTMLCCSLCHGDLLEVRDNSESSSWNIPTRRESWCITKMPGKVSWKSYLQEPTIAVNPPFRIHVKVVFISQAELKTIITPRCSFCSLSISF